MIRLESLRTLRLCGELFFFLHRKGASAVSQLFIKIVHHSDNTIFHPFHIEIKKQAYLISGQSQICKQLGFMNRFQFLTGFQLKNNFAFNQDIDPIPTIKPVPFVINWDLFLPCKAQASQLKLFADAFFIGVDSSSPGPSILCTSIAAPIIWEVN